MQFLSKIFSKFVFILFAAGVSFSVNAQDARRASVPKALLDDLVACGSLQTAGPRLACFDAAARAVADAMGEDATWSAPLGQPPRIAANASPPPSDGAEAASGPDESEARSDEAETKADDSEADTDREDEFGAEDIRENRRRTEESERADRLTATVTAYRRDAYGHVVVTLDNDQVWRQNGGDKVYPGDAPFDVTIKRNFMGGYRMTLENIGRTIRVERSA